MVLQVISLFSEGVLNVSPFQLEGVDGEASGEEETKIKLLEILGDSGQTELSYLLSNVSKQPRQP